MQRLLPRRYIGLKILLAIALVAVLLFTLYKEVLFVRGEPTYAASHVTSSARRTSSINKPVVSAVQIEQNKIAATQLREIPILMYHKTPSDFATQLDTLIAKGYTTITMSHLADYFDGLATLPVKPIIITFDDGFADQMQAYESLKARSMRATYYLITSGERSQGCIGLSRNNFSCGDSYLTWQDAETLARSEYIEIAAHTTDHANLSSLSPQEQEFQIVESKRQLERQLNVEVTSLAYPYGSFDATTVGIARGAGFRTAVTTIGGTQQTSDIRFTLLRVRDAYLLP